MKTLDLSSLRNRLAARHGKEYWKSLEELTDSDEFRQYLHHEFPHQLPQGVTDVDRRGFLRLMGASMALAGLSACTRQPTERIVPYVLPPERLVPGKPLYYATAMPCSGSSIGLLVETHMGRPTKIEGNPKHPASLGATDIFAQASILTLYDPDRSQSLMHLGRVSSWSSFLNGMSARMEAQRLKKGSGLRILTGTVTSPSLSEMLRSLLSQYPSAKWHQYEPVPRDSALEGARLAFGEPVEGRYDLTKANVVVSLDADFLGTGPGSIRYTREFSRCRRIVDGRKEMGRLYVVETTPTITGAKADHRLPMRSSRIAPFARALASALGVAGLSAAGPALAPQESRWVNAIAAELRANSGKGLLLAGDFQPPPVHALVHAMNHAMRHVGGTVVYTEPVARRPVNQLESLRELEADMNSGAVDYLVILSANPVYSAPADLEFAKAMAKVAERVHLGLYHDETAALCQWHIPEAHFLESWGDALALDGTASVIQPLIEPLYAGKSAWDLLSVMLGKPDQSGHDTVRNYWKSRNLVPESTFDRFWDKALHDGFIPGSSLPAKAVSLRPDWDLRAAAAEESTDSGLEISFRPDPTIGDGSFANNGWLQELPKPMTKLTWDNVAMISPATAERLDIANEDVLELRLGALSVKAPAWIMPGQAEGSVTVHLGYGRTRAGRVGSAAGFDAGRLRTTRGFWHAPGLVLAKTGDRYPLSCTQHHHSMEGRDLIRIGTLSRYLENPNFLQPAEHEPEKDLSLYPGHEYKAYAWGIAIDLHSCTGCNACIVACQSENNIPIVGKEQVARGREMHWIRLDGYHSGSLDNPETHYQPVMCMHCENAPCEPVCPVGATVHSSEGLNDMVYNRCVGTRYCSNNCPYKVRRFNFLLFSDFETPSLKMMRNPDVTVRSRGVMEKCTFCVQRISAAKIGAEKEDRTVRDGEIVTACEAVCPAEAIVFGNVNDPDSRVSKRKHGPLSYRLLTELNTKPRTTYLAKLKNPNPELA